MKTIELEERAAAYGASALNDRELLSSFLGKRAADTLMSAAGGLYQLRKWSLDELETLGCVTRKKALALFSLLEAGARACSEGADSLKPLDEPQKVYNLMKAECSSLRVERVFVLCLDRKNHLLKKATISSGTASRALVSAGEVFRPAVLYGASSIILVHNHPSGDPSPSRDDIRLTRHLKASAENMGIDLLDHIIIGHKALDPKKRGWYSFNDTAKSWDGTEETLPKNTQTGESSLSQSSGRSGRKQKRGGGKVIDFPKPERKPKQTACPHDELVERARCINAATRTPVPDLLKEMSQTDIIKYSDYIKNGDSRINEFLAGFAWQTYKVARRVAVYAENHLPEEVLFEPQKRASGGWFLKMTKQPW